MQDLYVTYPGMLQDNFGNPIGSASSRWIVRTQSGYTGRRLKPVGVHPYSFWFCDLMVKRYSMYYTGKSSIIGDDLRYGTIYVSFPDLPSDTGLYNRVVDKLNEQTRGSLDLAVDIAEAGQTVKMLKVKDQILDFSRTFVGRFGPLKAASNVWLMYTYGVKPLVSSLYGAADESLRLVLNKTSRYRARASERVELGRLGYNNASNATVYLPTYMSAKRSYTLGVTLFNSSHDIARWTSLNPVSLAWELMPFSFVADWFLDVGGYLRNFETAVVRGNQFSSGYLTKLLAIQDNGSYSYPPQVNGWANTFDYKLRAISIDRSLLSEYPSPRLPSFKANLGSSRLISAAALLSQILSGNRRV